MRVIERQMNAAIKERRNWKGNNTKVEQYDTFSSVELFGKHIANVSHADGHVYVDVRTLMDWPTDTTMSRLRALGANVYRRNWVIYLDDKPIG